MPPPAVTPSNLLIAAATAFRTLVNSIQNTEDPATRLSQTVDGLTDAVNMFDRVATTTAAFEQQFDQTNQQMQDLRQLIQTVQTQAQNAQTTADAARNNQQSGPNPTVNQATRKRLCEHRSVANLKMLGSKKEEFKNWNEKLVNATTQVFGLEWRTFMNNLNEKLDIDRKVLTVQELGQVPGATRIADPLKCNEEMYYLLVEKIEGDAALRVNSGTPGQGLQAYMRIYL